MTLFLLILFLALVVALLWFFLLRPRQARLFLARSIEMTLLEVLVPREFPKEGEARGGIDVARQKIAPMEQLFSLLTSLKVREPFFARGGAPSVALELSVHHVGEEIHFYVAVPKSERDNVEKQVQGVFPTAEVREIPDYNIFNPKGAEAGAVVVLERDSALPLRTYRGLEADPLGELTTALSKLEREGEGAAVQILLRPAGKGEQGRGRKAAKALQEGKALNEALGKGKFGRETSKILGELVGGPKKKEKEKEKEAKPPQITPVLQEVIRKIEEKAARAQFLANIRLITSAATRERAQALLDSLEKACAQFADPNLNRMKVARKEGRALKDLIYRFSWRLFSPGEASILATDELASLFHFPLAETAHPQVKFLKAKTAPPPANLPREGMLLGISSFRGEEREIRLLKEDRRRHLYIVGQTGTGKSALLQELIRQDMEAREGVCVLDPHGDLTEATLANVPAERAEDVILFDPGYIERPLGLNMLEYDTSRPEEKTFIVNEIQGIFNRLFPPETMGPMFEQYMRNALLLLMEDVRAEPATMMEVPRVFTDAPWREAKLDRITNPAVIDFWRKEAVKVGGEASLQNMTPYITSKFNNFIANDYVRPIIAQPKSAFNFREVMDGGKILLVNLSKGKIGDLNARLLGMIIVGRLMLASFARIDEPAEARRDFYLYIDEFQNFTTDSVATILAEARKYRLDLTIAHQFIAQLTDEIRESVFGNVGSLLAFRVGAKDAEFLVKYFAPVFSESDLASIDNFNAYLRLLIRGETTLPFNIRTIPPRKGDATLASKLHELSRLKYGRNRAQVEAEILERLRSQPAVHPAPSGEIRR